MGVCDIECDDKITKTIYSVDTDGGNPPCKGIGA